jgi:hypothetical protein
MRVTTAGIFVKIIEWPCNKRGYCLFRNRSSTIEVRFGLSELAIKRSNEAIRPCSGIVYDRKILFSKGNTEGKIPIEFLFKSGTDQPFKI